VRSWEFASGLTRMHIRTTGNSTPAVYWAVFEVLSRPDLVTRVRNIAQSAHEIRSQDPVSVELGNNPLLRSIFAEVTRLRVVGMVARLVTGGDSSSADGLSLRALLLGYHLRLEP
jgi:hypothetical protein